MEKIDPSIFKAYDIRGLYPTQIDAELVYKIAQGYVKLLGGPEKKLTIAVGHDMRLCGEELKESLVKGFTDAGMDVIDLGLISTDTLYFAVVHLKADGGIIATASHNPKEFGGLKLVREEARPVSGDSGIYEIRDSVVSGEWVVSSGDKGQVAKQDVSKEYIEHVLKTFDVGKIKPLKVVANANFGMANVALEALKNKLPIQIVEVVYPGLDGNFPLPGGRPDPLVPENRQATIDAIKKLRPDLGVAWDADADRCFFFDENGDFVTPAYINALLAEYYLQKYPGGKILHDTRVVRVIDDVVKKNGGVVIMTKAGHSFIKERMIKEQAVFGNETSGHYYFKDNFYLDNGLFPFMAVLEILSATDKTFSQLLAPLRSKFFISEEINFKFNNPDILEDIRRQYHDAGLDETDGYSFEYKDWRFNVRKSNTENLLRINLEANSAELLKQKTDEVVGFINSIK